MTILRYAVRRPALVALSRALNAVLCIGTSIYCLLVYVPFTYQQFIRPQLSAPLAALAVWHAALYWLVLAITVLTMAPALERRSAQRVGWAYLAASSALGLWLSANPVVAQPDPTRPNLLYALVFLVPPIWLVIFDDLAAGYSLKLSPSRDRRASAACWMTAAFVWVAYVAAVPVRLRFTGGLDLSSSALILGVAASAVAHLTAFAFVWIGLMLAGGAAALTRSPGRAEYWLLSGLSAAAAGAALMQLVLAPIAITGLTAWIASASIGVTAAVSWLGIGRHRLAGLAGGAGQSVAEWTALDAWLAPIVTSRSPRVAVFGLAAMMLAAHFLINRVATFDWNFMLQKLAALASWVVAFAFIHAMTRERAGPYRTWPMPIVALLLLVAEMFALPRLPAWRQDARLNPDFVLDAYAAVDPSYRVIREATRPPKAGDAVAFYAFLRANSNVQETGVGPAPIDFVRDLAPRAGPKPHIFLFVIDSLRRDYLSTHNAAVTFTPELAAFAADSYAFERAFTRYGGTALAVPSIWAGAMLFHTLYVKPFAPMNALQKLLDANQYRQFITADDIVDQLFVPANNIVPLAPTVTEMAHGFCPTVDALMAAMRARPDDNRPVFGHMRTLDLHIGNISSGSVPAGESYPGFFGSYAARVRTIDTCFGRFITFLKSNNLYDRSVVVVTSDHGDSLGEGGRWGHGFTVFPEVLRIPMIIHVPPALRTGVETDVSRVSFSTDITPTLYALLGEQPEWHGSQFGAPLLVPSGTDVSWRKRESYLVASSYGPAYGLIQHNGRSLYFADATYGRDYAFDLLAGAAGRRIEITDAERAANRRRIHDEVAALAARYHFTPQP